MIQETVIRDEINLTKEEKEVVYKTLNRDLTIPEAAMLEVMNSEHCSYKSSRPVLPKLPTEGPRVICGPGEDAGVVDIGDGLALVFKLESHNHPSALDPFNGAATGIGGIIRDILCMGARPIGLLDSFRLGNLSDPHTKWLLKWVTKGVGDYGNCVGISNAGGDIEFDPSFQINCLINVGCFGVMRKDELALSRATTPGDKLILLGGSTGRDGIGGASFASKNITEDSESDRGAVQIGDPYMKKLIIEATLEAIKAGVVEGLKDLGAAGVTCSISETADAGGTGTEIQLEKIRIREDDMEPWEILVSESQERMFFVVKPDNVKKIGKIFDKYELPYEILGEVTDTGKCVVKYHDHIIVDLPAHLLTKPPAANRKATYPKYLNKLNQKWLPKEPKDSELNDICRKIMASDNMISREWVYRQYDTEVGLHSVIKSGQADAGVFRLSEFNTKKGIAVTFDGNSHHCYLDPYNGGAGIMMEACSNVAAVGAEPIAMTDCLNFGNPEHPQVFWTFEKVVEGLADAAKALGVPCVGGNVSFYNHDEVRDVAVKPSPVIFVAGLLEDVEKAVNNSFKSPDEFIILIGNTNTEIGGSEYSKVIHSSDDGQVPKVDFANAKNVLKKVVKTVNEGLVTACHDISKGGLFVALTEMAMAGNLGFKVGLKRIPADTQRSDIKLFSETHGRFLMTAKKEDMDKLIAIFAEDEIPASYIGIVTQKKKLIIENEENKIIIDLPLDEIKQVWETRMVEEMEGKS
ncbi:MAG: phosphoribosylformylglycinamidine synthase subunit PurL [Candidatus Heimdallarchaeota archaeon]|nr:phosphoribosylformylglycinamidine synthase subunit PurL [Candidatus Heimdallarchaeota archaeon]MBY8995466.1 phosphoribosylformylglycinamidine synthase subunit PurL [Candidatus Heimdallarchaeota archaeon]